MKLAAALLTLCVVLTAAGCGESDSSTANSSQVPVESEAQAKERAKPTVTVPPTPPPEEVVVEDLIEGSGPEAKKGDRVEIQYVASTWNNEEYADSWVYSETPSFQLGSGQLSPGFDEGIRGMKAGGRREVIVPIARLRNAEAKSSDFPDPRPRDTLVIVVDLLGVN